MLIEIFGPNQEEVTKDGRKLHNGKLRNYYSHSFFFIFPIKIRKDKMGRACACTGEKRNTHWVLIRKPKERYHVRDAGTCGRIILQWILQKQDVMSCTGFMWLRTSDWLL